MQFRQVSYTIGVDLLGLSPFHLAPLGRVVALFGPNGAGKSRLLRLARQRMEFLHHCFLSVEQQLAQAKRDLATSREQKAEPERIARFQATINDLTVLKEHPEKVFNVLPTRDSFLFDLTNKGVQLGEVQSRSPMQRDACFDDERAFQGGNCRTPKAVTEELTSIFESIVACAERVHNELPCDERGAILGKLFPAAKSLVKDLMSMEFGYTPIGSSPAPTLNGRVWKPREFSSGQKNLLYYIGCILNALAREQHGLTSPIRFSGSVIIIDEPEISLHPHAVKELYRSLLKLVGSEGQLWIATHSLALLTELGAESMWLVRDGKILPRSRSAATKAIELLVGTREDVQMLADIADEPNRAMLRQFLSECILRPTVACHTESDPQLAQILIALQRAREAGEDITVLDVGAGTGRLAAELQEVASTEGVSAVEYVPLEPNEDMHLTIGTASGDRLRSRKPARSIAEIEQDVVGQVHVAVLCNVLHEVTPTEWPELLNGVLAALRQDGSLLICEDLDMPVGELSSHSGFLVLTDAELGVLFDASDALVRIEHPNPSFWGRLQCVAVSARANRVTKDSVRSAVESARSRLHDRIARLRSGEERPKDGRDFARACMMLLNCDFALEELEGPPKI